MQLLHLKNIEIKKESVVEESSLISQQVDLSGKKLDEKDLETSVPKTIKNQLKSTNQLKTSPINNLEKSINSKIEISSFQDLIDMSNKEREIELKYDLERNVKLVSFQRGKIDISFNEQLNKNFIKNLTEKLLKWTGERWIISLSKNNKQKVFLKKI